MADARREFILVVAGGLATFLIAVGILLAIVRNNDQGHQRKEHRIGACGTIQEPAIRTLCIVEAK